MKLNHSSRVQHDPQHLKYKFISFSLLIDRTFRLTTLVNKMMVFSSFSLQRLPGPTCRPAKRWEDGKAENIYFSFLVQGIVPHVVLKLL